MMLNHTSNHPKLKSNNWESINQGNGQMLDHTFSSPPNLMIQPMELKQSQKVALVNKDVGAAGPTILLVGPIAWNSKAPWVLRQASNFPSCMYFFQFSS